MVGRLIVVSFWLTSIAHSPGSLDGDIRLAALARTEEGLSLAQREAAEQFEASERQDAMQHIETYLGFLFQEQETLFHVPVYDE